ncbi:MAG: acetate--CoA ligase family protein [Clostridia bacterium]|nr:acetate--CoA ligase family protein [Clostridia bacterium]
MIDAQAFFQPRGVAVFGSMSPGKLGAILVGRLLEGGYSQVYAVNPKGRGFAAAPGFSSVSEIGQPLDLALIAAPAVAAPAIIRDCGAVGIRAAVIISSGFSEARQPLLEEELKQAAAEAGVRYIGPNCSGLINTRFNLYPTLEAAPPSGSLSLVSQSGAMGGLICDLAGPAGVGIAKFISFGNGSDINELDLLDYLKGDDETRIVAVYAEHLGEGRRFMDIVSQISREKPVIVIKSGRTAAGQRAALSHTGSLAGADEVYTQALATAGALRADSVAQLLDMTKALSHSKPLTGGRLAIITNSGGPGVMAADSVEGNGLVLPEPSEAAQAALGRILPAHAGLANPIDLTVEGSPRQYRDALLAMLAETDAALAIYIGTPYLAALPYAEAIAEAAAVSGKPVAAHFAVGADIDSAGAYLEAAGCPCFESGERAVLALSRRRRYEQMRQAPPWRPPLIKEQQLPPYPGYILEPQVMDMLAEQGLPTLPRRFVQKRAQLAQAAAELGYPLAIKVVSPNIIHKSDMGGVKLGIADLPAAEQAYDELQAMAAELDFRGVMLYPMQNPGQELIIGFIRDPQFGPVIMCGLGGVYAEIMRDVALRVAPVDETAALAMLGELRAWPLLQGARGGPALDVAAVAGLISRFSHIPCMYPQLREGEINPLFVYREGAVIADARLLGE